MKIGCTGCSYCMPCPNGVDIARCFKSYDSLYIFKDNKLRSQIMYAMRLGGFQEDEAAYLPIKMREMRETLPPETAYHGPLDNVSGEMEGIVTSVMPPLFKVYLAIDR